MKKEESIYLSVALIIVLIILAVVLVNFKSTGMVVLSEYTNQSSCEDAGYTWENSTVQNCTTETFSSTENGWINSSGYILTGLEGIDDFVITEVWNVTIPILILAGNYTVDADSLNVTNADTTTWEDVNFTYTYDDETCEEVTIWNCTGEICGDRVIQSPNDDGINEECDDGDNNDVECTANYDESCDYCSSSCEIINVQGASCGDGTCDNEEDCASCENDCGACESESTEETTETTSSESTVQIAVPKLTAGVIQALSLNPGDSQERKWEVTNTGGTALSNCVLKPLGDFSSWITFSEEAKNLEAGEGADFVFDVIVPAGTEEGEYGLTVSVECSEKGINNDFKVNVENKKLELNITNAEKTGGDKIKVYYSLKELSGTDQDVSVQFSILTLDDKEIANVEENRSIKANSTKNFRTSIPVNESVEGELNLLANFNSQIYSSSVQESLISGALVGGFAVSEGRGTGSVVILVIVVTALAGIFFVVRNKRKNLKSK